MVTNVQSEVNPATLIYQTVDCNDQTLMDKSPFKDASEAKRTKIFAVLELKLLKNTSKDSTVFDKLGD